MNEDPPRVDLAEELERIALAHSLKESGRVQEGYLLMLELIAAGSRRWEPYFEAGLFSRDRGNHDMAAKFLLKAADKENGGAEATLQLALSLQDRGRHAEALSAWSKRLDRYHGPAVFAALARFATAWSGPAQELSGFLDEVARRDHRQHSVYLQVRRQGSLPGGRMVVPGHRLPPFTARYHHMPAPGRPDEAFPPLFLYPVRNAVARPYSELVIADAACWVTDYVDLEEHLLYDTFLGLSCPMPGGVMALKDESIVRWLPSGILLTSYAVTNWSHFLTELAPLVALAEQAGLPEEVPLLVSAAGAPQAEALLNRIKAPGRPVIRLDGPTLVRDAYWLTPVSTVPFEFLKARMGRRVNHSPLDNRFSPAALEALRERCRLPSESDPADRVKLFIDRDSPCRRMLNREAVIQYFSAAGYHVVRPETLALEAQINLFARAAVIAGQSGAGLANMLFAPAGARVLVLSGQPKDPDLHRYFGSLACALGHALHYLAFGEPSDDVHIDFEVDLARLEQHRDLI